MVDQALVAVHFHLRFLPRGVGDFLPGTALAMGSAVLFGVGAVVQHHAATSSTAGGGLRLRAMARRRSWVVGQLCTTTGSGLQVAALALAPVAIVQPLLTAGLIVALGLRTVRERCWPTGAELAGAALTAGGLAAFLIAARPAPGAPGHLPRPLAVIAAAVLGLAVVALATRLRRGASGALACGLAAGLAAGIAAVLISSALKILSTHGLVRALAGPALWAAIVMAVASQIGAQHAFSRGALTWSLPALTVLDPLAAIPAARFLLGERLAPGHAAVWLPAGLVAAVGVVLLARSAEDCRRPIGSRRRRSAEAPARSTSVRGVDTTFSAELIEWRGPAPFYWLPLPADACDYVRAQAAMATYGWGAIPVSVRIGGTEWETSLLPRDGGYVLPVKQQVRAQERFGEGDTVTVAMSVAPRGGRAANGTGPTM